MGWHFKVGERLALVTNLGGRDANAWNSQGLDRIDFDLLGKLAKKDRVQIWIGVPRLVLRRMSMIRS